MKDGLLFAILAAVTWGLAPLFAKVGLARTSPFVGITIRSVVVTTMVLFTVLASGRWKAFSGIGSRTIAIMALEGLLAGLLGQYFYFKAIKSLDASTVTPIVGAYPLFTFLFAILILGEKFTVAKSLGALLVIAGVVLLGL